MSEDKGFLSRWSDRKLTADDEERQLLDVETEKVEEIVDEFEGKSDDEILTILELPDPETLTLGDTVEKFMSGRVPERIRARALRAFWKTNPVLANIDGLDEYCDDYTDAAMIIENMQTIYEVGKGYAGQMLDAIESLADEDDKTEEENLESIDQSISERQRLEVPTDRASQIIPDVDNDNQRSFSEKNQSTAKIATPKPSRMTFE